MNPLGVAARQLAEHGRGDTRARESLRQGPAVRACLAADRAGLADPGLPGEGDGAG
jgi:hypothetical protein